MVDGEDLEIELERKTFNELCEADFDKCMQIVENVIQKSGLIKEQIDDYIMVGGSSRITELQERMEAFFGKPKMMFQVNEDETVATGATIAAQMINQEQGDLLECLNSV